MKKENPETKKMLRIVVSSVFILLAILMAAYGLTQYASEQRFINPVAYTVSGDTLYVAEREKNTVLALRYSPARNRLKLVEKFQIEGDDPKYYYMIRRLYPGPEGIVVRSWIYDQLTKDFVGYRFRQYRSFSEPPQEIFTIFLKDPKSFPDVHYAFDKRGAHYFVNNCAGQYNIWEVPPAGNMVMSGGIVPADIRQLGEKNSSLSSWAWIHVDDGGRIFVSSVAAERIMEYSPEGLNLRIIGEVGFKEGQLLAPMEVFFTRMAQDRPPCLTVSSTGNRTWVQFDGEGRAIRTISPLKEGYTFPDIYVGKAYELKGSLQICSFDLVNKSLLVHNRGFKSITTYWLKQPGRTAFCLGIAVLILLPVIFYGKMASFYRRLRFPLFLKLLFLFVPLLVLCALVVGSEVMDVMKTDLDAESLRRSANLARAVVNTLSITDLEAIQKPEDRGSPAYERIYNTVSRIVDLKEVEYTPKWIIHKIRDGRYYFGINIWRGSIYEPFIVPRERTMFFKVLEKKIPQYGRFRDEMGEWFSYLTPIQNEKGDVIYVLELYRPTEAMDRSKKEAELWIMKIGGATLLLALIALFLFSYISTGPLRKLMQGTIVVKEGNFDHMIQVHSRDEIGALAQAFNSMVADLKRFTDDLASAVAAKERVESKLEMADSIQTSLRKVIGEVLSGKKSDSSFEWLVPHMEKETHKKGEFLFHKGEIADKMFYVKKGSLRLVEIDHIVGEGSLIGETGILSPMKERTMSVVTNEESEIYSMNEEKSKALFYQDPSLLFELIQISIKRSLENLKTTVADKERIEEDLRIGHDIQASVLPRSFFPDRKDFQIFASMEAAKEVGGDFYDFFLINERKLCFIIGDVSGKGVPAALFMMITKALLKTAAMGDLSPEEILFNVNNIISPDNESCMFVTILCAILDTETGELEVGNAGHNPPLIRREGDGFEFVELPKSFVLGPMEDTRFASKKMRLNPHDTLFLYTDGVTEAMNPKSELFSEGRLQKVLSRLKGRSITEIVHGVRADIKDFANGAPQSDDITMIMVKYLGT